MLKNSILFRLCKAKCKKKIENFKKVTKFPRKILHLAGVV